MPGANRPYTQLSADQVLQQSFDEDNDRLRTSTDVTATIEGEVSVEIDAADGDNIAISNADGTKKVDVETIGGKNALDVNIIGGISDSGVSTNTYNEISSVVNGALTTIVSYTAIDNVVLKKISVSGTNISTYQVFIGTTKIDQQRTYFGSALNLDLDYGNGLSVNATQTVFVKVIHQRPDVGDFNGRIQIEEN